VIKQCEGSAIVGAGGNNDILISGNMIDGTNLVVSGSSISFDSAERISIVGNKILNNTSGPPIEMRGSSKHWHITENSLVSVSKLLESRESLGFNGGDPIRGGVTDVDA